MIRISLRRNSKAFDNCSRSWAVLVIYYYYFFFCFLFFSRTTEPINSIFCMNLIRSSENLNCKDLGSSFNRRHVVAQFVSFSVITFYALMLEDLNFTHGMTTWWRKIWNKVAHFRACSEKFYYDWRFSYAYALMLEVLNFEHGMTTWWRKILHKVAHFQACREKFYYDWWCSHAS